MQKALQSGGDRTQVFQNIQGLSLAEQQKYAKSKYVSDFYYTLTSSFNADDKLTPIDTSGNTSNSTGDTSANGNAAQNPQGNGGGNGARMGFAGMGNQGDFTVIGYSSHDAMTSFIDGTSKIEKGTIFDQATDKPDCIISDELALQNNISVGDKITLINPNDTNETVLMTIVGTYSNSESSTVSSDNMMGFRASSDPANRIYLSYNAIKKIVDNSAANATVSTDANTGRQTSTALRDQESGTYVFTNENNYNAFQKDVANMGLDTSTYMVTSSDLNSFEQSITPLEHLSSYATYFLLVVLAIGGAILVVFNVFAIRERKYEIGVLAVIGMNKLKVGFQFISEVFIVTFIAIIIGTGIGSAISVPIANKLLESQVAAEKASEQATMSNFGGGFQGRFNGANGANNARSNFMNNFGRNQNTNYISDITASVDVGVMIQLLGIGILLTIVSSATAVVSILRYEPLKILSNRT
ncbi:MAG TPA: ABC transporter permease [Mobilitalea sp.]|nr:ABC transporter permease [Mobilitalea sp.]